MSVSTVSSYSAAQFPPQNRAGGLGKEIREGIGQLRKAVESGDLEAAQSAYDSLSKLQSERQGSSGSSSSSTSTRKSGPLSDMLSSVGAALQTGDVSQVQQAFAAASPKGPGGVGGPGGAGGPPPGGPPPGGPPPGGGKGGPSDEVSSAFGDLASSLSAGDLSGAQAAYSSLTEMLGSDDDDSSSSSSSNSPSSGSSADTFTELLGDLGTALQSGHMATAQSLFASLAPRGSQGVDVTA